MKFLCDVHIPYKLTKSLTKMGFESVHINTILNKWHTTDNEISQYANSNNMVVITKDSDFRDSFFVKKSPQKLIKVNLGNISNKELIKIFKENIDSIAKYNSKSRFLIEIDKYDIRIIDES